MANPVHITQALRARILGFQDYAATLLTTDSSEAELLRHYRALKVSVLAAGAGGEYEIHDMELCLRRLSRMRRLAEQVLKGAATLQRLNQTAAEAVTPRQPHSQPA